MARFLVRRIALALLVLWLITVIVFLIFYVAPPNDVARTLAGKQATPQSIALIRHRLGLDKSLLMQYWIFIKQLVWHQSLGYSYYKGVSVNKVVKQDLPITASLILGASLIWLALGVLNGVLSAIRPRSFADRAITSIALFFYSLPTFVLGLFMLFLLFYKLTKAGFSIFPASGYVPLTQNPLQWAHHLILPWFTIALVSAATYTRLTRGSLLDVMGEDYIRTARAKGLPERRVIFRHGLRAALTPVVTQFGIDVGVLLGGAIVTETVFSLPGLGWEAVKAINAGDLPIVIGITLVGAFFVTLANLIVDVFYATLDPRVRLS